MSTGIGEGVFDDHASLCYVLVDVGQEALAQHLVEDVSPCAVYEDEYGCQRCSR